MQGGRQEGRHPERISNESQTNTEQISNAPRPTMRAPVSTCSAVQYRTTCREAGRQAGIPQSSGSSPQSSLLSLSIEQPRIARAPLKAASSLLESGSPAQRELPQSSLLPLSNEQPRAAGAPPKSASSLPQSGSPAQRELPPKQPPPSFNWAAPRSGRSSPQITSLLFLSIEQPRAARAPLKQPPSSLYRAAPRSGSSPQSSLLPLSIGQPRAAGAPPKQPPSSLYRAAPRKAKQSSLPSP